MHPTASPNIQTQTPTRVQENPFPGLRPFGLHESHLFFGREGQSEEVLQNLSNHRFVAVLGASGSGKSSLMYCGIVPLIHGGFIEQAGTRWRVVTTRPGSAPIQNMAEALAQSCSFNPKDHDCHKSIIESVLRSSSQGLCEATKQLALKEKEHVLLLVDQFEELFRFKNFQTGKNAFNEALAFVKLLTEANKQHQSSIYVILTMRSDFLGECAQYQELTSLINRSHFLIPQMTRENMRQAILGPVAVGGGEIAARLVNQLLNDVGDNPDQLPILQHAMMRTWDYWTRHKQANEPVDISHYEAVGRLEKALNVHANEAFGELSPQGQSICESMFKTLTETGSDNRGVRKPTALLNIAAITGTNISEVSQVIETFRKTGRSFVTPSADIPLADNAIIDISHESLMRIWERLKTWVDEEVTSAQVYLRLAESATAHQAGKAGLWKQPDLQMAINWKQKQKPTLAWGKRYHPAYERTMVFLQASEDAFRKEEEAKLRRHKRALRRSRIIALILGTAAVVSVGVSIYAIVQQQEAKQQKEKAHYQTYEAERQRYIAVEKQELADEKSKEANKQRELAETSASEARKQQRLAEEQRLLAEENAKKAQEQEIEARNNLLEAKRQQELADKSAEIATYQKFLAEESSTEAYRLLVLSIAQSMAVKSLQISDQRSNEKALVAYQAFQFNKGFGGNIFNPDVYTGLYFSLKAFSEEGFNQYPGHQGSVRSLQVSVDGKNLYSAGSDGKIMKWGMSPSNKKAELIFHRGVVNRSITPSPDGQYMAILTDDAQLFIINLKANNELISSTAQEQNVWAISFLPDNKLAVANDSTISVWDLNRDNQTITRTEVKGVRTLCCSPDGKYIAAGNNAGLIYISKPNDVQFSKTITTQDSTPVTALSFNPDGSLLAVGNAKGRLSMWGAIFSTEKYSLDGHNARITDIEFSKERQLMASASFDGTVQIRSTQDYNLQPIVLKDENAWVWSVTFSEDGNNIYTGFRDNLIQQWPTTAEQIADQLCSQINRNLTAKEWSKYIGSKIPYEQTCETYAMGDGVTPQMLEPAKEQVAVEDMIQQQMAELDSLKALWKQENLSTRDTLATDAPPVKTQSTTIVDNKSIQPISIQGVFYAVQIIVSDTELLTDSPKLRNASTLSFYKKGALYAYVSGNTPNLSEIIKQKNQLRSLGFKDAFVVAFKNGKRISLKEAKTTTEK